MFFMEANEIFNLFQQEFEFDYAPSEYNRMINKIQDILVEIEKERLEHYEHN
jgi:hypothetical protein